MRVRPVEEDTLEEDTLEEDTLEEDRPDPDALLPSVAGSAQGAAEMEDEMKVQAIDLVEIGVSDADR